MELVKFKHNTMDQLITLSLISLLPHTLHITYYRDEAVVLPAFRVQRTAALKQS